MFLYGCSDTPARRPNILFISIDTLRADHLGAYGYPRPTSPYIDHLAANGRVFGNVLVPLPATDPSHASLFTSLSPIQHGVLTNGMTLGPNLETIAEVLKSQGYFTMGAVSVAHMTRKFGFDQGFELFSDTWDVSAHWNDSHRRVAPSVNESVYAILDQYAGQKSDRPFFLFVHYFDVHRPYTRHEDHPVTGTPAPPPSLQWSPEDRDLVDRYDSEIRLVDEHIRQLHAKLRQLDLTNNLITCIWSDHGEQLGERGLMGGHADIYRETVHIPFILHGCGIKKSREERLISSMDISVSLLDRLEMSFSGPVTGTSFLRRSARGASSVSRDESRGLLIFGYPRYTRSVGFVQDNLWYIRNLDHIYRVFASEPLRPSAMTGKSAGYDEAQLYRADENESVYLVPLGSLNRTLQSAYVTAEVRGRDPNQPARLRVQLEPRMSYLSEPLEFEGSIRIHYPVSSRDTTAIVISPGNHAERVLYTVTPSASFRQFRESLTEDVHTVETALWRKLKAQRKENDADELYDMARDPRMLANLADDAEYSEQTSALKRKADQGWERHVRLAGEAKTIRSPDSKETLDMLKSLGYIQ